MDGYKAYQYYMAVKLHFTKDSFDVFNNPKVRCSYDTFDKRRDKSFFNSLARKYPKDHELIQYYVSNFAYGHKEVVYEEDESKQCFFEWNKRKESITKVLDDDINTIILYADKNRLNKNQVLEFTNGEPPCILSLYLGNHISVESLRIIDDYMYLIDTWKQYSFISLWQDEIRRLYKLKRFVKYDKIKVGRSIERFVQELEDL